MTCTASVELSGLFANPRPTSFMLVIASVVKILDMGEVLERPKPAPPKSRRKIHLTEAQMHDLVASYLCGATILDLAARHDICRTTVSKYLKQTRWPSSWQRDWLTKSRLRYDEPPAFNVPGVRP